MKRIPDCRWLLLALLLLNGPTQAQALASWNDSAPRQALQRFVAEVTQTDSPQFVPVAQRIAVFDNDGTLWSEQPAYFQVLFAFDEIRRMAPAHPQWKTTQPFQAVLENDQQALAAAGTDGLMKIIAATHTGMSSEDFAQRVRAWFDRARHPKSGKPYNEMIYQPMLELMDYLREQEFKVYIVSGGDSAFMRTFTEQVYGVPPEQVIGSAFVTEYRLVDGQPTLLRLARLARNDDGPGKPESIDAIIGRRPLLAFGNSDGDLQMLQWTAAGQGPRFMGLVHHTDARREWAYDRQSHIGRLDKALDEARQRGWTVVDMARDWTQVFAFDNPPKEPTR
ncbi:haloacid dehalogenase-like hydrolase [Pseudomonas sp. GD04058]|uniref:HAD family hydrolase n=1 Tax=Pseudomonas sp. GD04058 TaxID=2975429 RepID=UPI00244D5823|nr:HAD family hydrolase [Pseudomonas sp. GD04058]MDG9881840.1 haloacid dehalogenase-like hydrolase [Pseudomonas sp. GD04058]